jgi:multiple sugar transport system permease protein
MNLQAMPPEKDFTQTASQRVTRANPLELLGKLSESRYWAYILLAPSLLLVLSIIVYPVFYGIFLSFQQFNLMRAALGMKFVGLEQYIELFKEEDFYIIIKNTFVWVVFGACSQFLVGLITALALNRKTLKGGAIARVLLLLPWVIPSVVAGHMWALLLDSRLGVINDILVKLGIIESYLAWFASPVTAMPSVLLVDLWRGFPFFTLLLYAGLQSIPEELYEAAEVDGASGWQKFVAITLPMLTPVIVAAVILRVIALVNSPDLMIVLTNGGPGLATFTISLYAFQIAYENFNFGAAAAVSVIMLLILMIFTTLYFRFSGVTKNT